MLNSAAREAFDRVFEEIVAELPADVKRLLEETPVILDDEPTDEQLEEVGIKPGKGDADLCGLHSGIPLNQRSVWETPVMPGQIYLFRGPIFRIASGRPSVLRRQIQVTLLHELGHHFGFDHSKLKAMGYL